jgi:hypothetical protein
MLEVRLEDVKFGNRNYITVAHVLREDALGKWS